MASKRNPKPRKNAGRTARRMRGQRVVVTGNRMISAVTHHADGGRTLELTRAGGQVMEEHLQTTAAQFERVWGRPMRGDDPVFPDFSAPTPTAMSAAKIEAQMVEAMEAVGIHPSHIYAFQQTGLMLTQENMVLADPAAVDEWYEALDRWDALHA